MQSKYIQKRCAHVRHHGLLHTMLQAAQLAAQSVTTARWALSCSDMLSSDTHCEVMPPQAHRFPKPHAAACTRNPKACLGSLCTVLYSRASWEEPIASPHIAP